MINLSLDELRLIAQNRNISDYENKSKEDLIKALREPKPGPKPKKTPKQILKPETKPKQTPKLEAKPKPKTEIKINRKKLKKHRKDLDELRHKFSNKVEIREYRKAFYDTKN